MRVTGIDHVVLRVADIERAAAFYTGVIGCTLERRRGDLGMIHLRAGDALIDLVVLDGPLGRKGGAMPAGGGRNLDHLCLRIAGFEASAVRAALAAQGIETREPTATYGAGLELRG